MSRNETSKKPLSVDASGLLDRRLLIVSGKGGVGKSTVAAGLALLASRTGRNVIVVEIDTVPTVLTLLGGSGEVGYRPREVRPRISVVNIDGFSAIEDYLSGKVGNRLLLRKILGSRLYRYFVAAAPGLKELMCVGKLWDLVDNQPGSDGRPLYDLVIADMPATGHGFSHLRMPRTAVETLKIGFVKEEAAKILRLFQDPGRAAMLIVTLAEEMPVNEAIDLRRLVTEELGCRVGAVVVNGVYPSLLGAQQEEERQLERLQAVLQELRGDPRWRPLLESALTVNRRRAVNRRYIEQLRSQVPDPLLILPFLFTRDFDSSAIDALSRTLAERMGVPGEEGSAAPGETLRKVGG